MLTVLTLVLATALPVFAEDTPEEEEAWDVLAEHGPVHTATIDTTEGTWMSVTVHGQTVVFDLLGDLWSIPLAGGEATRLTSGAAWDSEPRFSPDGSQLAFVSDGGGNEQLWIMDADGSDARQVTDEEQARVTDPVWDPDGPWLLGRRRTVDTRSIGVTELWQYHLDGGPGFALTSKDAHPHAGEMTTGGRHLWFSSRAGRFDYDANPLRGLWQIMRLDRETGELRTEISGNGGAIRPHLTPDGSGLVFASRDRTKTMLEYLDLETRERRVLGDWLDHDQMEGFALHGVYPSGDWTDEGDLVIWAGGKLWRVSMTGKRTEIPFRVSDQWTFHDVPRWPNPPPNTVKSRVNRWTTVNRFGDIAYSAMGRLIVQTASGQTHDLGTGFAPNWAQDGRALLWTSWSDADATGRLHITGNRGRGGTTTLPIQGQLVNPAMSEDGKTIAVLRDPNTDNSPRLGSIPWYELIVLQKDRGRWLPQYTGTTVDTGMGFRSPRLTVYRDRIWWLSVGERPNREPAKAEWVSTDLRGRDKRVHLHLEGAVEASPSPDFSRLAYKLGHQAWVTALPKPGTAVELKALPQHQLSDAVGDWLGWTPDGAGVHWTEGDTLVTTTLSGPGIPSTPEDTEAEEPPDTRLRTLLTYAKPRHVPDTTIALTHATVITMEGDTVVEDATVLIEGDRIAAVGPEVTIPEDAQVLDVKGKTIIPGLIDVHAHLHYGSKDITPEQPWDYNVNLDFGVTTVQDPGASTDLVFTQAERVESGLSQGPRVYSTGFVLYGALGNENAETPDRTAAHHHVERLKMVGAKSVKVYQQSRRDQRQWYVEACNANQILCVAEGGGDLWMNLAMVSDGFHAIEHALPNAPVYNDVQQFMAASRTDDSAGTAYSPTLLVAYGGLSGELYYFDKAGAFDDPRLLRHWDRRDLDAKTYRRGTTTQDEDWNHQQVARDAAVMAKNGVLVTMGAHGQLQGLGVHWELWALGGPGAMSPMAALRAGTIDGARYMGLDTVLGSIAPGKLADLIVLNADPRDDLKNTTDIHLVIKNGQVVSE